MRLHMPGDNVRYFCICLQHAYIMCLPLNGCNMPGKKYLDGVKGASSSKAFLILKNLAMAALVGHGTTFGNTPCWIHGYSPGVQNGIRLMMLLSTDKEL